MDMGILVTVGGAILGQVAHIVKKKTEETKGSESEVFKQWIIKRPFNTLGAVAAAIAVAFGLQPEHVETANHVLEAANAFVAGIAANSVINRPGQ